MTPEFESLGSISRAIAGVALLLAAAFALGSLLIRVAAKGFRHSLEVQILRIAVGLNLIATVGVALGALGWLADARSLWFLLALALGGVLSSWQRRTPTARKNPAPRRPRIPWPAWPALALAVVTLGPALCYPTGWDELVYHHVLPRRWLVDGRPAFYPDLAYSGFPSLGEILFWLVAPIESVIAPRLLTWVCWLLGLILLYRLLRRRVAAASAAILTLAFGLSETALMISANCYVESILMMNVTALMFAVGHALRGVPQSIGGRTIPIWCHAAILGVLAGGSAAIKLTGLPLLALPCLWYLGQAWHDRSRRRSIAQSLALYLLIALAIALPFYLRPWLLTGNPFYPYYSEWFTLDPARLETSRYHHALGAAFGIHNRSAILLAPVLLAFDSQLYDGTFGWQLPIIIALAALALLSPAHRRIRPFVLWPSSVFLWLFTFWCLTAQQARFAIPAMLALLLLAAFGLRRMHGRDRKLALAALLAAALISAPWRTTGHYFGSWLAVLGVITRSDYVNESTDRQYLPLVQALHDHIPADAKLMLLFEHRGFYLPRAHQIGTPFFQESGFTLPERFTDPASVMDLLTRERITHVVMTRELAGPDKAPVSFDRFNHFDSVIEQCVATGRLHVVWASDRYFLLQVQP
jgi:hypothetical protein